MLNYKIKQKSSLKLPHHNHFSHVKLPTFDKKPSQTFKKSLSKIRSGKLPLLHLHDANVHEPVSKPQGQLHVNLQGNSQIGGNFAQEIEEKVHSILNKNHMFNMDYYASQNQNFQRNIEKNKEYLKEHRGKRLSILRKKEGNVGCESPKEDGNGRNKRKEDRFKVVSKEKRRNKSPAVGNNAKSESVLSNDSSAQKSRSKGGLTNRLEKKMHELKKKLATRKKGPQSKIVTQGDAQDAKSQNLFDNIHNYLANPQRLSFDSKDTTERKLAKRKKALQAKLKLLEQKMAALDLQPQPQPQQKPQSAQVTTRTQNGVSDWRRMQFHRGESKHLTMRESNFQKEVNHINHLQMRNEQSLERHLQNQRMLFDLKMIRGGKEMVREYRSK